MNDKLKEQMGIFAVSDLILRKFKEYQEEQEGEKE